jgi:competence protein ComEA
VDREKLRLAGYAVAAVLVVLVGMRFLSGGGDAGGGTALTVDPASRAAGRASYASGARRPGAASTVLVQVAGEVNRPGVYRVPAGGRVQDAVEKAGGLTSNAEQVGINLVARVQDGQQVIVPKKGAAPVAAGSEGAGAASGGAGAAGPSGPISLASASEAQLESLDGIGPTLARRIVDYRQAHGGFRSIDELRQVSGIGEKRFEALKKSVAP